MLFAGLDNEQFSEHVQAFLGHMLVCCRLRRFPFGRAFVENVTEDLYGKAIITSITRLADALEMQTTVEGIEKREQFDILRKRGWRRLKASSSPKLCRWRNSNSTAKMANYCAFPVPNSVKANSIIASAANLR